MSFSVFGTAQMSDEQFVAAVNATMVPGLQLLNILCEWASGDRGQVVIRFELDDWLVNVAGFSCVGYLDQTATYAVTLVTGQAAPSVEYKTNFIAAAPPAVVHREGLRSPGGKSVAFTEAKMWNNKTRLIATTGVTPV